MTKLTPALAFVALATAALSLGCGPSADEPTTNDPGLPFGIRTVTALNGYAYASGQFSTSLNHTTDREALVILDLVSLFVENKPSSSGVRKASSDAQQNVFIWELQNTYIWDRVGTELLGATPLWSADGAGAVKVQSFSLADPLAPRLARETTIPGSTGYVVGSAKALGEQTALIYLTPVLIGEVTTVPPNRLIVIKPATGEVLSDTTAAGCHQFARSGQLLYCFGNADSDPTGTADNVFAYALTPQGGLGALVQSLRAPALFSINGAFAGPGVVYVTDVGGGTAKPSAIQVFTIGADGKLATGTRVTAPEANGHKTVVRSVAPLANGMLLVGAIDGAFIVDPATGSVLSSAVGLMSATLEQAEGLAEGDFLSANGSRGVTLYRADSMNALTRVGTFHRSWGDRFPNYGSIYEGKY